MVRSEREQLSGIIEINESLVGGIEHGGKRGRGTDKAIVVIAVEIEEPMEFGRIRMRHILNASGNQLILFICEVVIPGATVQTDGWSGYNNLKKNGYVHQRKILSSYDDPAHVSMPGVHRIASLLK